MVGSSSGMYALRPLVKVEDPVSASSMYRMKRLVTSRDDDDTTGDVATSYSYQNQNQSVLPSAEDLAREDSLLKDLTDEEVEALKALRENQLSLLFSLDDLRLHVDSLKREVGVHNLPKEVLDAIEASLSESPSSSSASVPNALDDAVIRDIVVCARPDRPPLAVLVYFDILNQFFKVTGTVHTHSSVAFAVPKSLRDAFGSNGKSSSFNQGIASGVASRAAYDLAMTLIWKDVPRGSEMMIAPHRQARILGDASICRYLARICQPYDQVGCDAVEATEIDAWTDAANCSSDKEVASHVKALSSRLAPPRQWLVGDGPSLADVVNWALVRSSSTIAKNSLPANVENWRKRCEERREFQLASRVASHLKKR